MPTQPMAAEDPLLPPGSAPCPPVPDEYNFVAEPMLGPSGLKLMTYSWTKRKAPKGIVVLCHGYGVHQTFTWYLAAAPGGEHVVFNDSIVQRLCDAGYAVRGIDHQGHGRSESARGLLERGAGELVREAREIAAAHVSTWKH